MGDKSTSAGEASINLASPAAVKYSSAFEAVLLRSNFNIRVPNNAGLSLLALVFTIYFF